MGEPPWRWFQHSIPAPLLCEFDTPARIITERGVCLVGSQVSYCPLLPKDSPSLLTSVLTRCCAEAALLSSSGGGGAGPVTVPYCSDPEHMPTSSWIFAWTPEIPIQATGLQLQSRQRGVRSGDTDSYFGLQLLSACRLKLLVTVWR